MRGRPAPAADETALLGELDAIYAEVDRRFAGWSCDASTTCCRFGLTGREPYVTAIELLALRRAARRSGRRPSAATSSRRRGLPIVDRAASEGRCPLLGEDARCTAYASRPLGCRTFFCDRAIAGDPVPQRDVNDLVRRIRDLSLRLGRGDDQGRPLTRAW